VLEDLSLVLKKVPGFVRDKIKFPLLFAEFSSPAFPCPPEKQDLPNKNYNFRIEQVKDLGLI